jgi:RHS repeat-associated protein
MGDQEIAEYDNGGNLSRRYVYGAGLDEPLAMVNTTGQHSYHLTDALGSVIGLLDDTGALTERHAYTAYGTTLGSSSTPYLYAGRRLDDETGLYHNRARAYSPVLGRFLQADPIGTEGGINFYAYVVNDPVNKTDPSGLEAVSYMLRHNSQTHPAPYSGDTRLEDFAHFEINAYVFTVTADYTKYGDMFVGGGINHGFPNPVSIGVNISAGWMVGGDPDRATLNGFLGGPSGGGSLYAGVGGAVAVNPSGKAVMVGVGFGYGPGGTYNKKTGNIFGEACK